MVAHAVAPGNIMTKQTTDKGAARANIIQC